jgi:hypothetical protein
MSLLGGDRKEISPGGSVINRYQAGGHARIAIYEPPPGFSEAREAAYRRFFGEPSSVWHEVLPQVPHIDVYTHPAGQHGRNYCTMVTGGMSDQAMKLPPQAIEQGVAKRVELIFYCSEPRKEYLQTLQWLAHFPHNYRTWVTASHTIPNGDPPEPMWGTTSLDSILLMPTIVKQDAKLPQELVLAGEGVEFLWVVPLTRAECKLKLDKGYGAILELFAKHRHPHVFDPNRKSYV